VARDAIEFRHPLDAAAAYAELTNTERRSLHRRLAEVVPDPQERAAHRALGSSAPDAQVAAALDAARDQLLRLGRFDRAVEAARLAVRVSPLDDDGLVARQIVLAELFHRAGDADAASQVLRPAVAESVRPDDRARALVALARVDADPQHLVTALALSSADPLLSATIRLDLANLTADTTERLRLVDAACSALGDTDFKLRRIARGRLASARLAAGHGTDDDHAATEVEDAHSDARSLLESPEMERAWRLCHLDEPQAAAECLTALERHALARIDEPALVAIYRLRSQLAFTTGDWDVAARIARRSVRVAERGNLHRGAAHARLWLAWILAHRGEDRPTGDATEPGALALAALRATHSGDTATAAEAARQVLELGAANGWRDPSMFWFQPQAIDTLVAAAQYDDAELALQRFETDALRVQRRSALAIAARCRAALLASLGELDRALEAADDALARLTELDRPFERGRALLIRGTVQRRLKRKALARTDLEAALAQFERCGARPFIDSARDEVRRLGSRSNSVGALTPTEQRVADLVAAGLSNQQVADALFITRRTVEANLARIYQKLNVRNRVELTTRLAELLDRS
jgi:DNA-binding CsgD family transcriptional regulator